MLPSFLLALREGVEAALVIGIVLGALRKFDRQELRTSVWFGALAAVLASILVAVILRLAGSELEGRAEMIFEGVSMWLAAGILTWMIFWMSRQSRSHRLELEQRVRRSMNVPGRWPLFGVAFLAVFREGLELALFLAAAGMGASGLITTIGAGLGLAAAAALGWMLFHSTRRLPLSSFFRVTNVLLILFAAGLATHGMHEFVEAGIIPSMIPSVYNLNPVLPEESLAGQLLKTLFGYNGSPALTEILAYFGYFATLWLSTRLIFRKPIPAA